MDAQTIMALVLGIGQLGLGAAAYRLGTKVASRQDAQEKRTDNHERRIGVLEVRVL